MVRENGMRYSTFMHGLNKAGITIDRKVLADLAVNEPQAFMEILSKVQAELK